MKRLEIIRLENGGDCIRGVMRLEGELIGCTLERPYLDNRKDISAIPAGEYEAVPYNLPKFGAVYKLTDVPDRTDILIHEGNTAADTQGCIIVGQQFEEFQGVPAVLSSKKALATLKYKLKCLGYKQDSERVTVRRGKTDYKNI